MSDFTGSITTTEAEEVPSITVDLGELPGAVLVSGENAATGLAASDDTPYPTTTIATIVPDQYDELLAKLTGWIAAAEALGSPGGTVPSGSIFVFNSAGATGGNRYTNWALLEVALAAVDGPKVIQLEQNETAPASELDLNGATFLGLGTYNGIRVTFPTGSTIINPGVVLAYGGVTLYSSSTAPILTVEGGSVYLADDGVLSSKACEFVLFDSASVNCILSIRNGAGLVAPSVLGISGGDYEAVRFTGSPDFAAVAEVSGLSQLQNNQIRGDVTVYRLPGAMAFPGQEGVGNTQTNLPGWTVMPTVPASRGAYTPAVPSDWSGTTQLTVNAALDRLAAAVGPV